MSRTTLDQGWSVRLASDQPDAPVSLIGAAIPAVVPGHVHLDLLAAGLIPDPYLGTNELAMRWIGRSDWTYSCRLHWPGAGSDARTLVFEGLDTVGSVWLDDVLLGEVGSTHRTWRFDVTHVLTPGDHVLEVRFRAPLTAAEQRATELGDYPHTNAYPEPFNMIRVMACSFGWDWGPQLPGAGIWRPVWIESATGARLVAVRADAIPTDEGGRVDLSITTQRVGLLHAGLRLIITIAGARLERVLDGDQMDITLDVPGAQAWWPHSRGAQPLTPLLVELWDGDRLLDTWQRSVGFRAVALDTTPDALGSRFQLVINGQPVWVRGANWIPDDCFPARVTRERYRQRIQQARDAHIDLLRVWGGGIFEADDFYEVCDELGMLVWQDLPFACATYPDTDELREHVHAEVRDNVGRLRHHPSLVLWNGNNECVWLADDLGWPARMGDRPWGRQWWEGSFPELIAQLDPRRPYWPGSPTSPAWSGAPPNSPDHGTMHIWDVWNRLDAEAYREHAPRFAAEFGYQAPATWATLARALGPDHLGVGDASLIHRQKATDGMAKLQRGLASHHRPPADFDDWLFLTQLEQARAISLGVGHLRSIREVCSGSVVWQLNDCWPVISWSAVDGDGRRKPLWYALRRAYADRLLTIEPGEYQLRAVLANDTDAAWDATLLARRLSLDGVLLARAELPLVAPVRGSAVVALPTSVATPRDATAEVLVVDTDGHRSVWTWLPDGDLAAPPARVRAIATRGPAGVRVDVTAETLVRDLCLFADRAHPDATVDEMLVTLLPGESTSFLVSGGDVSDPDVLTRRPMLRCVNDTIHS